MQVASSLDSQWPELVGAIARSIDLEATARSSGALIRRRQIRSAEQLLRLALAYGPGGLSLRAAAVWAGIAEGASLSDTAVMQRVRKAADWLGEIAGALVGRASPAVPDVPDPLPGRRLRIVDGSVITRPGSTGSDWRLHAAYDPALGCFTGLDLTDGKQAEGFGCAMAEAGDLLLGDRGYARPLDLRAVLDAGADFIVRVGWARLRLLEPDGATLAWEPIFNTLAPGGVTERRVVVEKSGKGGKQRGRPLFEARLIVLRLSQGAAARAAKAVRRRRSRKQVRSPAQPLTLRSSGFLMLLTSLPDTVSAAEVLGAYRLRWQVELAFKRLKSLIGIDRLPAKSDGLARSWLLAHLILALLIGEAAREHLPDSPPCAGHHKTQARLALAHHSNPARRTPARHPRRTDHCRSAQ
jgi:hypothetical protein